MGDGINDETRAKSSCLLVTGKMINYLVAQAGLRAVHKFT